MHIQLMDTQLILPEGKGTYRMSEDINRVIKDFVSAVNDERDYIKGHDIGRELLLSGEHKQLAKLLASIAGLAKQYETGKVKGYEKFRKMVTDRMDELPDHPFDEAYLKQQMTKMDQNIHDQARASTYKFAIKLK